MRMLSILIPTKDYDCHILVEELHRQGESLGLPYEIIIGEDGTAEENLRLNTMADSLTHCRRIIKKTNIGRAAIRNLLARESRYPNLIFIDCDAVVEKDDFLRLYADALKDYDVVCGALYHANEQPNDECSLRYRYEKEADKQRDAVTRSKAPYDKFTTFNFAIKKDIFTSILFNESITRYGYEDALFGKELKRRGIPIGHIDNKLLHCGLESNAVFLAKSEQALATLLTIEDRMESTPLLAALRKMRALHLENIFMIYWNLRKKSLRRNLLGRKPSLLKFKIYKLGYYISLQRKDGINTL